MTVTAKAIINKFYGSAPKFSYWTGCSAGGRQAMKEAQMFPADFDGIIAGSPGLDWSGRTAQAVRIAQALQKEEARITPAKAQVLHIGRRGRVRRARWREGWPHRESARLQVRSRCVGLQRWRGAGLPDAGSGRYATPDLLAHRRCEDEAGDSWSGARERAGMDRHGMVGICPCDRTRSLPVPGVRRSAVGCAEVQRVDGRGSPDGRCQWRHRCARPEPQAVLRSRRQVDSVPRLERSADHAAGQHGVLRPCCRRQRRQVEGSRVVPVVHGTRHGALRRR